MGRERDPAVAASTVESGDALFFDTSAPAAVTAAIARRDDLEDVTAYAYGYPYRDRDALAALGRADGIELSVSMIPPALRDPVDDGTVEYVPRPLYAASREPFPGEDDRRRVAIFQVSDDGGERTCPLSCLSTFTSAASEPVFSDADVLLAQRNPNLPASTPRRTVRADAITTTVSVERAPPQFGESTIDTTVRAIAEAVVELLPAYPTVQLGIGAVGTAVGERLADRGPLDVWSGLLGTGVRSIVEGGAARSVTGSVAVGTDPAFYEWVADADALRFAPPSTIHAQHRLRSLSNLVAINSALQVDLRGAANAESIDGRPLGGIGGQLEFMRAASSEADGLAIIALPSRTAGGHPKIVPSIGPQDPVTTPSNAVDAVVTEHGVADLRGLSPGDRAAALIEVAHPDDRERLREAAER
jgi:acyl-CoA hydrolase